MVGGLGEDRAQALLDVVELGLADRQRGSELDDRVLGSTQAIDEFHRQTQAADDAWFALSRFTGS